MHINLLKQINTFFGAQNLHRKVGLRGDELILLSENIEHSFSVRKCAKTIIALPYRNELSRSQVELLNFTEDELIKAKSLNDRYVVNLIQSESLTVLQTKMLLELLENQNSDEFASNFSQFIKIHSQDDLQTQTQTQKQTKNEDESITVKDDTKNKVDINATTLKLKSILKTKKQGLKPSAGDERYLQKQEISKSNKEKIINYIPDIPTVKKTALGEELDINEIKLKNRVLYLGATPKRYQVSPLFSSLKENKINILYVLGQPQVNFYNAELSSGFCFGWHVQSNSRTISLSSNTIVNAFDLTINKFDEDDDATQAFFISIYEIQMKNLEKSKLTIKEQKELNAELVLCADFIESTSPTDNAPLYLSQNGINKATLLACAAFMQKEQTDLVSLIDAFIQQRSYLAFSCNAKSGETTNLKALCFLAKQYHVPIEVTYDVVDSPNIKANEDPVVALVDLVINSACSQRQLQAQYPFLYTSRPHRKMVIPKGSLPFRQLKTATLLHKNARIFSLSINGQQQWQHTNHPTWASIPSIFDCCCTQKTPLIICIGEPQNNFYNTTKAQSHLVSWRVESQPFSPQIVSNIKICQFKLRVTNYLSPQKQQHILKLVEVKNFTQIADKPINKSHEQSLLLELTALVNLIKQELAAARDENASCGVPMIMCDTGTELSLVLGIALSLSHEVSLSRALQEALSCTNAFSHFYSTSQHARRTALTLLTQFAKNTGSPLIDGTDHHSLLLESAASGNAKQLIVLLSNNHSDLLQVNQQHQTALMLACSNGHHECVDLLMNKLPEMLNQQDRKGLTAFMHAAAKGHTDCISALMPEKAAHIDEPKTVTLDSNLTDDKGRNALMHAVCSGSIECVRHLIENGKFDFDVRDRKGESIIELAIRYGHQDIIALLLELGAFKIEPMRTSTNSRLLMLCARYGATNLAEKLLLTGYLKVNYTWKNTTALRRSLENSHHAIVVLLLNAQDIDLTQQLLTLEQLLFLALSKNSVDCVKAILQRHDPNINAVDGNGYTPLMLAVKSGNSTLVKLLLASHKIDVSASHTETGNTALMLAIENDIDLSEIKKIVSLLIEKYPQTITQENNQSKTAAQLASDLKKPEIELCIEDYIKLGFLETRYTPTFKSSLVTKFDGISPLAAAVKAQKLDDVISLLEDPETDVNHQNLHGVSAIMIAACAVSLSNQASPSVSQQIFDALLKHKHLDVTKKDKFGRTALFFTAMYGNSINTMQRLLEIEPDGSDHQAATINSPIAIAAELGIIDNLKWLVTESKFTQHHEFKNMLNHALLTVVADSDKKCVYHSQCIDILLAAGAKITYKDQSSRSVLHHACEPGNSKALIHLLSLDSELCNTQEINYVDSDGFTPLMIASKTAVGGTKTNIELVKLLLAKPNIDVSVQNPETGDTALMCAITNANKINKQELVKIVRLLIEKCPSTINQQNNQEKTAIILAGELKQTEVVKCIQSYIEEGYLETKFLPGKILKNMRQLPGISVLASAVKEKKLDDVMTLLAEPDTDINHQNVHGVTALMVAVCVQSNKLPHQWQQVIGALIEHKNLDVTLKDRFGRTALFMAAMYENNIHWMQKLLEIQPSNTDHTTLSQLTPISIAATLGLCNNLRWLVTQSKFTQYPDFNDMLNTALLRVSASKISTVDCLKLLLEAGAQLNYMMMDKIDETKEDTEEIDIEDRIEGSALHCSCRTGNTTALTYFLSQDGIQVNVKDKQGVTPLLTAIEHGQLKCVQLLLAHKNIKPDYGQNSVLYSVQNEKTVCLSELLACDKVDTNATIDPRRTTPLMQACKNQQAELVRILLTSDRVDVGAEDILGQTALMFAVEAQNQEMVALLLAKGANLDHKDYFLNSALDRAIKNHQYSMCELLLGKNALIKAVDLKDLPFISYLLTQEKWLSGANRTEEEGSIAAFHALKVGSLPLIKALLEGGDPNITNANGTSLLMKAAELGLFEITVFLIDLIGVGARDNQGRTALHYAASSGSLACVGALGSAELLLATCNEGKSALMLAAQYGHRQILKLLIERHINIADFDPTQFVNQTDNNGKTALHHAVEHSHVWCIDVLLALEPSEQQVKEVKEIAQVKGNQAVIKALEGIVPPLETARQSLKRIIPRGNKANVLHKLKSTYNQYKDYRQRELLLGDDALINAVKIQDVAELRHLLTLPKWKHLINSVDNSGNTALEYAVHANSVIMVNILKSHGADIQQLNQYGGNLLTLAAGLGFSDLVRYFLSLWEYIDCYQQDNNGLNPLHYAAKYGHKHCVKILLTQISYDTTTTNGQTSLMLAAEAGHTSIVECLLQQYSVDNKTEEEDLLCSDIHFTDANNRSALMLATENGHTRCVKMLLAFTVSVQHLTTSKSLALAGGHTRIVAMIDGHPKLVDKVGSYLTSGKQRLIAAYQERFSTRQQADIITPLEELSDVAETEELDTSDSVAIKGVATETEELDTSDSVVTKDVATETEELDTSDSVATKDVATKTADIVAVINGHPTLVDKVVSYLTKRKQRLIAAYKERFSTGRQADVITPPVELNDLVNDVATETADVDAPAKLMEDNESLLFVHNTLTSLDEYPDIAEQELVKVSKTTSAQLTEEPDAKNINPTEVPVCLMLPNMYRYYYYDKQTIDEAEIEGNKCIPVTDSSIVASMNTSSSFKTRRRTTKIKVRDVLNKAGNKAIAVLTPDSALSSALKESSKKRKSVHNPSNPSHERYDDYHNLKN